MKSRWLFGHWDHFTNWEGFVFYSKFIPPIPDSPNKYCKHTQILVLLNHVFQKSKKVGKCFKYQKPHMRLESYTIEVLGHSQTAWQTSSGNCLQCSQTSSVNNFRWTKLVLTNRALLQALQTKFHVLFGTLQP